MNRVESDFFKLCVPLAQSAQRKWGVPTSVSLAQAILESAWGQSRLSRAAWNYFGVKATQIADPETYIELPTDEFIKGRKIRVEAKFARYATPADSFDAHARLLASAARYAPAMAVRSDVNAFADRLASCGYSTSPAYADQLRTLIDQFDLTQYDLAAPDPAAANGIAA